MTAIRKPILIALTIGIISSTLTATFAFNPPAHSESAPVVVVNSSVLPALVPFLNPTFLKTSCSPACVRQADPSSVIATSTPPVQVQQPPTPKKKIPPTTNEPTPNTSSPNSRIETVITFALAQLGKPYRWAAAGPSSYDCSGLVMTAFSKIGMKLPHFTGTLIGIGRAISRGALQRGDIVFPQRGHVAIYLGNGKMVHAPQTGDVVKVSSVYAFYAGRRLL